MKAVAPVTLMKLPDIISSHIKEHLKTDKQSHIYKQTVLTNVIINVFQSSIVSGGGGGDEISKNFVKGGSEFSKNQRGKIKGGGHENAQF